MNNWTEQDLKVWELEHSKRATTKVDESGLPFVPKSKPVWNKTEARYAQYLDLLKKAGEIADWRFQEWKFQLAPRTHYTPDFAVLRHVEHPMGAAVPLWTLYDVKGRKVKANGSEGYWAEEDAKLKIKLCPRLWPWFRWCIVFPKSNGEWEEVEFRA